MLMESRDLKDRYVNPYTDFGFKKFFEAAEIAKFTKKEYDAYEDSLKTYRDWYSTIHTAEYKKACTIAKELKAEGVPMRIILKSTGLTEEEINAL